jgi:hypothetical protein
MVCQTPTAESNESVDYARLVLEPEEAVRSIFLALSTPTGFVPMQDFIDFLRRTGAVDGMHILDQDLDAAIEYASKKSLSLGRQALDTPSGDSVGTSSELTFQKFKIALVCHPILIEPSLWFGILYCLH